MDSMDSHMRSLAAQEQGVLSGEPVLHNPIARFFVQAAVIIGLCRGLSVLGFYFKQPRVIFEIIGGILLGLSALSRISSFASTVFKANSLSYLNLVANIGLTLYLFVIGMELDPSLLLSHGKPAVAIALVGMAVPFALGVAISGTLFDTLQADDPIYGKASKTGFFVFIGTAMSITAFPVLARLLKEGGLIYTKAGAMVMGAAAINDAVAWCLLILAISISNSGNMGTAGFVFLSVLVMAVGMITIIRVPFTRVVEYVESFNSPSMNNNLFAFTLCILFVCAWTTDLLGVHPIFGAFIFGLIIPRKSNLFRECNEFIEPLVLTMFLPLYFAYSGLSTDITTINDGNAGAMVLLVCMIATVGKFIGAGFTALACGLTIRESATIAVLMNTRGLVELIVLNLGLQAGILSTLTFSVMVLMCLFTTFLTTPLVNWIYPPHLRLKATTEEEGSEKEFPITNVDASPENVQITISTDILDRSNKMKLTVLVDKSYHTQCLMDILYLFAPSEPIVSSLSVNLVKFLEPSLSDRDEFLGLDNLGRVIRVDEVPTTTKAARLASARLANTHHASVSGEEKSGINSQLLTLSMFARTLGSDVISAFQVVGDPSEFPTELQKFVISKSSDLVLFSWHPGQYTATLFWGSVRRCPKPIALIAHRQSKEVADTEAVLRSRVSSQSTSDEATASNVKEERSMTLMDLFASTREEEEEKDTEASHVLVRRIIAVISGGAADATILSMALRFARRSGVSILVLITGDRESFNKTQLDVLLAFEELTSPLQNISITNLKAGLQNFDELVTEISCQPAAELIITRFVEPLDTNKPGEATSEKSLSRPATLSSVLGDETGGADVSTRSRTATLDANGIQPLSPPPQKIFSRKLSGMPTRIATTSLPYPELGLLGDNFHHVGLYSFVVIVHDKE